jgi:hypothetical protein
LNTAMNFRVPKDTGNFLISWVNFRFWRSAQLHWINYAYYLYVFRVLKKWI